MYKKLIVVSFIVVLLITSLSVVNAQTDSSTDSADRLKQQLQELEMRKLDAAYQTENTLKMDLKQQIKDTVAAKRLEMKAIVDAKREEFQKKLQTIKDERKRALVERIDAKIARVNIKHTDRFAHVLGNLQTLVDEVNADASGTEFVGDISSAQTAIDTAKTAVEVQAAKTYTIAISTESNLKSNVGTLMSQFRKDLVAAHKLVVDAKQFVQTLRRNVIINPDSGNFDELENPRSI